MKKEIVANIVARTNLKKSEAAQAHDAVMDAIKECVVEGCRVILPGLGKLQVVARPSRAGRHPRTGKPIVIPAGKRVKFTPNRELSKELTGKEL
ncbi:MAG: HU family DNA-binding protein [Proteobacteria bacterium]|nr:HU family DNA-binding protein [Pseudomonadota bacterium]